MITAGDRFNVEAISLTALEHKTGESVKIKQDTQMEVAKVYDDQKVDLYIMNGEDEGKIIRLDKAAISFPCSKI